MSDRPWPPRSPEQPFYCDRLHCELPAGDCSQRWWRRVYGTREYYFPGCGPTCDRGSEVVAALGTAPRRRTPREVELIALAKARNRTVTQK